MARSLSYAAYRALTCPLRLMPDFIIIGTQRGGTSAFYHYLTEHPNIGAATTKELNYFDKHFRKGPWWYRAHFPTVLRKRYVESVHGRKFVTGEASPYYLFHPLVPKRLAATLPGVKLIALLRNPVDRAYSQYRRNRHMQWETLPFSDAIAAEERRLGDDHDRYGYNFEHFSYLTRGIYADQLQRWLCLFPRERFLILKSEDFYADPAAVLKQTLAFLGVPAAGLMEKRTYNRFDGYTSRSESRDDCAVSPALRRRLNAFFAPHNRRLYELLGKDLGWE